MAILVTGGSGFIGSHTCIELLNAGYEIIVLDNLSNSHVESIEQVREITGKSLIFEHVDLLDKNEVMRVFTSYSIEAVIHFAGLKAVGESVSKPLFYYHNNVAGTLVLCEVMQQFGVKNLVFSSSATVYGLTDKVPITETTPLDAINPYGRTKLMIEEILRDLWVSDNEWSISLLRYFNPIGAHESGKIGEDPNGIPNNLIPYITQVAVGKLPKLQVFGDNYETADGTGVRDYIHVVDLAKGHLKALAKVLNSKGIEAYNLGTGIGYSVLQVLHAFEQVIGVKIPFDVCDRRPGDVAISYADPSKAQSKLGWKAEKDIYEMCRDAWKWQKNNVNGFRGKVLQ